jgi:uncharacterized protein (TIGR00645 family)
MTKKIKAFTGLEDLFEGFIFWSRWVQAPMYGGLIIGAFLYMAKFFQDLGHMYSDLFAKPETAVMLAVLGLVDMSMVMNLIIMVAIGGYSIFTSKIDVDMHEDKPLWLEGLDAGMLKIKLATSLASISGVQLLKTFVNYREAAEKAGAEGIIIEIVIHMVFIFSALLLGMTEKIIHSYPRHGMTKVGGGEDEDEDEDEAEEEAHH